MRHVRSAPVAGALILSVATHVARALLLFHRPKRHHILLLCGKPFCDRLQLLLSRPRLPCLAAAAIAKPKRQAPPRPTDASLRGRALQSNSLPLPTERLQQSSRPGVSRTETRPGASRTEPRMRLHHQRSATLGELCPDP